jgi:uncharacterized membrane protein
MDAQPETLRPAANTPEAGEKPRRKGSVGPRSLRGRIVAGILIIIPLAVTAIIIRYVFNAALSVGVWLVYLVNKVLFLAFGIGSAPRKIDPANAAWHEIGIAVVLTILMLYLLGWLGTNVAGRRIIEAFEALLERIPFFDTLYVAVKRIVQALSGSGKGGAAQQRVVLIDFPHENMKTLAFMTNTIKDSVSGRSYATVFVPTTPNPTSGYMELVPLERITTTDWTMQEALAMILSGGASAPPEGAFHPPGRPQTRPTQPVGKS